MMTVREVAERLGARRSTVRIWAGRGRFKGAQLVETPLGPHWVIPADAVEGFELRGRGRPPKAEAEKKAAKKRSK